MTPAEYEKTERFQESVKNFFKDNKEEVEEYFESWVGNLDNNREQDRLLRNKSEKAYMIAQGLISN